MEKRIRAEKFQKLILSNDLKYGDISELDILLDEVGILIISYSRTLLKAK